MSNVFKSLSLIPTKLRHQLYAAIALMVVMPMGALFIFAAMLLPGTRVEIQRLMGLAPDMEGAYIGGVLGLAASAMFFAFAGWGIISRIIDPLLRIASGARSLAEGEIEEMVDVRREDELGDITAALNQLTLRAKKHMDELRQYTEQSKAINTEIHKRSMAMAGLLQIGTLISQSADLETILELTLKQLSIVEEGSFAFLYLTREQFGGMELRSVYNLNPDVLAGVQLQPKQLIIDDQQRPNEAHRELYERLGGANVIAQPVMMRGREVGLLGVGNHAIGYTFDQDYLELLTIFSKQVAIAVENDRLVHEVGELAIKDDLTGLYNEHYIRTRLDEEIKRAIAYQRPCAFVLFEVDAFQAYCDQHGKPEAERMLKRLAWVLLESITELDRVGRFGGNAFALLLPERNKRQAAELAEAIRKRVAFAFSERQGDEGSPRITLSGGVSENPIDGVTADDLLTQAQRAMGDAKVRGHNCVIA